ncbi:hypothetical protein ACHAPU_003777 [Fusarium lateritium]
MENPGYQDKDKLADAKQLAAMFKNGGKNAMSGNKGRGDRSRNSSIPMKRQVTPPQPEARQTSGSIKPITPVNGGTTPINENRENIAKELKVPTPTHSPTTPETPSVSSNVDLLRGLITPEPNQSVSKSSMETRNMATTFFSLMSQDSDEESDDSPATEAEEEVGIKSNTTEFLRYTSDELLKLRFKAKNDVLPPDSIVRRTNAGQTNNVQTIAGQTNGAMVNTNSKGNTNIPGSTSTSISTNTMGRSKLAAAIGKASSHLARPQQAGASQLLTDAKPQAKPQATLLQPSIAKPDALQASSEVKPQSGVIQQAMDKLEAIQIQAGPKLQPTVVQEVTKKPQEEVIQQLADKAEDLRVQTAPGTQIAVVQNSDVKPQLVTTQKNEECAISREQARGKTETSMGSDSQNLRPQAPGFVPGLRVASLASFEVVFEPAQDADSLVASLLVKALVTPSDVAGSLAHSGPLLGQFVTTVPIHLADGELIPGQSRSQFVVPSEASPINSMPTQLGTFSANLPIRIAESSISQGNNALALVAKPRKPTKGLSASMWAK